MRLLGDFAYRIQHFVSCLHIFFCMPNDIIPLLCGNRHIVLQYIIRPKAKHSLLDSVNKRLNKTNEKKWAKRDLTWKEKPTHLGNKFFIWYNVNFIILKQQHGDGSWQEPMVSRYLACLEEAKETLSQDELIDRTRKVAIVL